MYGWMHSCMCVYPIYVIYPIQIHTSTYKYVHWIPASMNPFHNLTTLKYSWVWGSHPMSPGQGPSASQAAHWPGCNIWPTEIPVPSCWTVPHPWDQRIFEVARGMPLTSADYAHWSYCIMLLMLMMLMLLTMMMLIGGHVWRAFDFLYLFISFYRLRLPRPLVIDHLRRAGGLNGAMCVYSIANVWCHVLTTQMLSQSCNGSLGVRRKA